MSKTITASKVSIINAAIECYKENGVQESSMDLIAMKANRTKTTLYTHFGSKENLFCEVINFVRDQDYSRPLKKYVPGEDVTTQLYNFFEEHLSQVLDPEKLKIYRAMIIEIARLGEKLELDLVREEYTDLPKWLNDAIDDGALVKFDTEESAINLWATISGRFLFPAILELKTDWLESWRDQLKGTVKDYLETKLRVRE